MFIFWFIIIIVALILVHELGHFLTAKFFGIRVDEFGIGFPPRIFAIKKGETTYTLNAIPFGGFVKIFGEDPDEVSMHGYDSDRSFVNKPKWNQVVVLVAGVTFNILFAWLLISVVFMVGMPTGVTEENKEIITNSHLVVVDVLKESPAHIAGLQTGDVVESVVPVREGVALPNKQTPEEVTNLIRSLGTSGEAVSVAYGRDGVKYEIDIIPQEGLVENGVALGVQLENIGTLQLNPFHAFFAGAVRTFDLTIAVAVGLGMFIFQAVTGSADFSTVAGPVGIVGIVGDASLLGFVYILNFIAIISINLAVINLIPFPALDGGRVLFVIIEKIKGSPITPKIANTANGIGFVLLLLLMLVVTFNDILKLF